MNQNNQIAKGFVLCALVSALSFIDAQCTNMIGFEANPIMIPFMGVGLYFVKISTIPLLAFLGYIHPKYDLAKFGMIIATIFYVAIVMSELFYLYIWTP